MAERALRPAPGVPDVLSPEERQALLEELFSDLPPEEYLAAQESNGPPPEGFESWDALGAALPNEPGDYVSTEQSFVPDWRENPPPGQAEDLRAQLEGIPEDQSSEMDFGRGTAFSDAQGRRSYTPHKGPRAGEAIRLPDNLQGPMFEAFMEEAEQPLPSQQVVFDPMSPKNAPPPPDPDRERSSAILALLREMSQVPAQKPELAVTVGEPKIHRPEDRIGPVQIMPPAEEPMMAPELDDQRRRFR